MMLKKGQSNHSHENQPLTLTNIQTFFKFQKNTIKKLKKVISMSHVA